jgi:hypothetical protein
VSSDRPAADNRSLAGLADHPAGPGNALCTDFARISDSLFRTYSYLKDTGRPSFSDYSHLFFVWKILVGHAGIEHPPPGRSSDRRSRRTVTVFAYGS